MDRKLVKEQIKTQLKELPLNIGITSLALLFSLAERNMAMLSDILEGPGRITISKVYAKAGNLKTFWDYYDELKNLKQDSARVILWRLRDKGLVEKKDKNYKLTSRGLGLVKVFQRGQEKPRAAKKWDGKWRIAMFDIPENRRAERNWIRFQLFAVDYKPLQKSVFIGKQPIGEDIYQEILDRELAECVRLLTVGEIDDEEIFKQFS